MYEATDTVLAKIPDCAETKNFSNENPSEDFIPANEEWEEKRIPILMQSLVQWGKELQKQKMTPMQLAHGLNLKKKEID